MISSKLKEKLDLKYNLVCFKDLACLSESPYAAYKVLDNFYKPSFEPNERLVFYSNETPNNDFITHLYRVAEQIDISNCFILIIAPGIKKVVVNKTEFEWDNFDCLELSVSDSKKLHKNYIMSDTICPLPWAHLELDIKNNLKPCCVNKEVLCNFENKSLNEGFYSTAMDNLRQDLLDGKQPVSCNKCWTNEALGLQSNRKRILQKYGREFFSSWIHEAKIRSLDLKPSNVCNFKCRVCDSTSSSAHAAEEARYSGQLIAKQEYSTTNKLFMTELPSLIQDLQNIDFYGGEPFYIPLIKKFVRYCVENNQSSHLRLHFNTNGSVFPEDLKHCWQHFKQIDIQFSIDNIGKRFELERGGSWHTVEQNIKKFIGLDYENMTFGMMPVVSIMNVFYLDEIFNWAKSMGLPVHYILLTDPTELSITNITQDAKNALLDKYKNNEHEQIQEFYKVIKDINVDTSLSDKFHAKMKYFDEIRNQSFSTSHPEIASLMGYNSITNKKDTVLPGDS